jgi:hypothetical protein
VSDDEWIPIDGPVGENIADTQIITFQFHRLMALANQNLFDAEKRAAFKCGILGLEAYLWDVLSKDQKYLDASGKIKDGKKSPPQEEINKALKLLKEIKLAIDRSPIGRPASVEFDASENET